MKKWLKLQIRQIFSTNLWTPVTIIFLCGDVRTNKC